MRCLAILLFLLLSTFGFGQTRKWSLDVENSLRSSALASSLMDTYQTCRWMDIEGTFEYNPLAKPFVGKGKQSLFVATSAISIWGMDRLGQSIKDKGTRTLFYGAWYALSTLAVYNNYKRFKVGFPVFWISGKF